MTALTEPPPATRPPAESLEELVRDHHASVWRLLRFLGADPAEADDLTQETFLAVARGGFTVQSPRQTAAYLRTVAKNQLLMLRRKQSRQVGTVAIEAAEAVWAESVEPVGWSGYAEALAACTEKLDGRAAQAIELCYRQSQSREAIAQRLDMQPDGVKTLLRRTRAVLRECIEKTLQREAY